MPNLPLSCGLYTRVSTRNQLTPDYNSLQTQQEKLEAYVRSQDNLAIYRTYEDGGFSADSLSRPALQEMIQDIREKNIACVLVYKIDRLTRSVKDFYQVMEFFEQHGVKLISVTQSFDTQSPMGRLMRNILLDFAQFEREMTADRTRDKMHQRAEKGMWNGGNIPYGYTTEGKQLKIQPEESSRVRFIFHHFSQEGSLSRLRLDLHRHGWYPRTGRLWSKTQLAYVLRNPLYVGKIRYNGNLYPGQHEALVTQELFEKVQGLHRKRTHSNTKISRPYVLQGLLRCASCHTALTPHYTQKRLKNGTIQRTPYYRCTKTMHHSFKTCSIKFVNADQAEHQILAYLQNLSKDEAYLQGIVNELNHALHHSFSPLEKESKELRRQLKDIEEELQRYVRALGKGTISLDRLEREIQKREEDHKTLAGRLKEIDQQLQRAELQEYTGDLLIQHLGKFHKNFSNMASREQAEALQCLIKDIEVHSDKWVLNVFEIPGFNWDSQKREGWLGLQDDFRTFRIDQPEQDFFAYLAA